MDSRGCYTLLILIVAALRVAELARSRRNVARLRARGGVEAGAGHYPAMVALHTAFLPSCLAEVWGLARPCHLSLATAMGAVVLAAFALRYWAIVTLGERWTTRVVVLPAAPLVRFGPYRFVRHPNYLAVAAELPALALVHTAWLTAAVFGATNLALLRHRIRVEERALTRGASAVAPGQPEPPAPMVSH